MSSLLDRFLSYLNQIQTFNPYFFIINFNISSFTPTSSSCCPFFRSFTKLFHTLLIPFEGLRVPPFQTLIWSPELCLVKWPKLWSPLISFVFVLPSRPRSQVQIFSSALRIAIIQLRIRLNHNAQFYTK